MKIKMKRILLICFSCLFILSTGLFAVACAIFGSQMTVYNATGDLVYDNTTKSITIEYGETYALPQNVQIGGKKAKLNSIKLIYEGKDECKLSYGSYQFMKVGEYDVEYVVAHDGKTYKETFGIVCEDSVAPVINVVSQSTFGYLGSEVELPKCTYADKAGIKDNSAEFTVTSPSGQAVQVLNGKFLLEELGYYVVTVSVKDNNGNESTQTIKVHSLELYVDEDRVGDVIYSFNDEKYTQLTVDVKTELKIDREIVREGYPTIENEQDGNGVLKISSTDTFGDERDTYGVRDLLTQFNLHEDLLASTGYNIVIRIAVSTDTDYVKLFRSMTNYNYASQDKDLAGQMFGLKANTWYNWEIDPISFGYNMPFENFVISFRDSGNTALYIDEIYFTPEKFVDTEIDDNVIADFDENGYLYNVFQNVYCDPTTTRAERVAGTEFSIVSGKNVPAANSASAKSPNLAPSGNVLKAVTTANKGGMTFMFPEAINLDEISRITFRMYLDTESSYLSTMVIGFFNGNGYDGGNNYWTYADSHYKVKEWFEIDFETNYLKTYATSGNTVSGFYIYLASNLGWDTPVGHTVYFDEIRVTPSNEHSEQVGGYLATFDTQDSLANVTQPIFYRGAMIGWDDDFYHKRGALLVKPSVSKDGFHYYFDEILTVKESDSIIIDMAKASDKVKKVSIYAINLKQKEFFVKDVSLESAAAQKYNAYSISCKDILNSITDGKILGLRVEITISALATDAFLAVNEIVYYNAEQDKDVPEIGTVTAQNLTVLSGKTVDLRLLDIPVVDTSDPAAYWFVESLKTWDNQSVTLTDGYIFTPTAGGTYTLVVKAKDNAGNVSAESKTIKFTLNYYQDKAAYYNDMLNFAEKSATSLVKSYDGNVSIVEDAGCEDGKGVQASFINYIVNDLSIDVGGVYQFKDIDRIVITYKIIAANKTSDSWWRVFLNDNTAEGQQVSTTAGVTFTDEAGRGGGTMTSFGKMTIKPAQANTLTGLSETDYFTKISFGYRRGADNANAHGVTLIIDSIKVYSNIFNPENLEFNGASALALVESGANPSIVTDGSVTGVKATIVQPSGNSGLTPVGRQDLRINVGGKYQFKNIEKIVITYKVTASNNTDGWWRLFFNDNTTDGQQISKATGGVTFTTETGRQSEVMTTYCMLTIEPAIANSATGLSGEDSFYAISIGYRDYVDRTMTIIIDSIQIVEKEVFVFNEEYLKFGESASLGLVSGLNVSFVEDSGCTDGKGVKGSFARDDKNSQSLKINLGGNYKIAEIDKIVIRYKMTEGNDGWYRLYVNGKNDKDDYRLQSPNITFASSTSSQAKPMNEYSTITINQAAFTATAGPALAETDTLDSLEFWFGVWQGSSGSTSTLIIDSIQIVLK